MGRSQKSKIGTCVYCGKVGPLTRDHIPPKTLFATRPPDLITVPCCEKCNKGFSGDDTYFRDVVSMRADVGDHPEVQRNMDAVLRSVVRPEQRKYWDGILGGAQLRDVLSPSGLYVGQRPAYDVNVGRLDRVVARIVKGLFYHEFNRRLPETHEVAAYFEEGFGCVDSTTMANVLRLCSNVTAEVPTERGANVFRFWYKAAEDSPDTSLWVLQFYGTLGFMAVVGEKTRMRGPGAGAAPVVR